MSPLLDGRFASEDQRRKEINIFCCYADKDEPLCDELKNHLGLLKRAGPLIVCDRREIAVGADWKQEVESQIKRADVILLLLSADFLYDGYEMTLVLERYKDENVYVLPILLRAMSWEDLLLSERTLPKDEKGEVVPVMRWPDRDEALNRVVEEIRKQAIRLRTQKERTYWVREGERLAEKGEYTEAEEAYRTALNTFPASSGKEINPEKAGICEKRADLLRRLGRYQEAAQMYWDAAALDRAGFSHFHHFGDVLAEISDYKNALGAYRYAAKVDPQNAQLLQKIGDMLSNLNSPESREEALAEYDKALKIDPTQIISSIHKGYLLRFLKRFPDALKTYEQALQYDPANVLLLVLKGTTLCESGSYVSAIYVYDQALALDPTSTLAYYGKAFALTQLELDGALLLEDEFNRLFSKEPFKEIFPPNPPDPKQAHQTYKEAKMFGYSDLFQSSGLISFITQSGQTDGVVYCPDGHENWYLARFCTTCGEKLDSKSVGTELCLYCKKLKQTGDRHCPHCGQANPDDILGPNPNRSR